MAGTTSIGSTVLQQTVDMSRTLLTPRTYVGHVTQLEIEELNKRLLTLNGQNTFTPGGVFERVLKELTKFKYLRYEKLLRQFKMI